MANESLYKANAASLKNNRFLKVLQGNCTIRKETRNDIKQHADLYKCSEDKEDNEEREGDVGDDQNDDEAVVHVVVEVVVDT